MKGGIAPTKTEGEAVEKEEPKEATGLGSIWDFFSVTNFIPFDPLRIWSTYCKKDFTMSIRVKSRFLDIFSAHSMGA